jgi:hypothetical protein
MANGNGAPRGSFSRSAGSQVELHLEWADSIETAEWNIYIEGSTRCRRVAFRLCWEGLGLGRVHWPLA